MNKKGIILYLFFLFFSLPMSTVIAEKSCSLDVVCIHTIQERDCVDIYFENLKAFDVTLTLNVSCRNMQASIKAPYTETFSGYSKAKILYLTAIDKRKRWQYKYVYNWTRGSMYVSHDDSVVYSLPYKKGQAYKVIQGYNGSFSHHGNDQYAVDFGMPEGTFICAARDGVVVGVAATVLPTEVGAYPARPRALGDHAVLALILADL